MDKLEIKNVSKQFGNKKVLDDVSFQVHEGEFLSMLGSSGCGKTTLLRILIGIDKPSAGEIWKDGVNITDFRPNARGMGIVFQNYALFPNMTVYQNIAYALKARRLSKDEIDRKVKEAIQTVGLEEQANKKPYKMSGGQQQRVAIARTLVLNPDIILFDEPMASLDADISMNLRSQIKELQKKLGITMIYVTHDQEEAFSMSDRIMVIHDNKIVQLDTPERIYHHPKNDYVRTFVVDQLDKKVKLIRDSTK